MEPQTTRKTFKDKLQPTPDQERLLERTSMRCRHVDNAAVGARREAWRQRGVAVPSHRQKAEVPGIKAALPEYGAVTGQVLQDVVLRVERAHRAFLRRAGGRDAGLPALPGARPLPRLSFTSPQVGDHGGARLDDGLLVLAKVGRLAVRRSRPIEGTPKTVTVGKEADGW